jgi:uncharacterized protein YjdB
VSAFGGTEANAGGICGRNIGLAIDISDCYNEGIVSAYDSFGAQAGGISGYGCNIDNCYNTGNVSTSTVAGLAIARSSYAGGISGRHGDANNCYNTGFVNASGDSSNVYAGGICGYGYAASFPGIAFDHCLNLGDVSSGYGAGGISGYGGTISYCYNTGDISGGGETGGISGSIATISNCYNMGDVSGGGDVGGISGFSGTVDSCYNIGGVSGGSNVGGIVGNTFYGGITTISNSYWNIGKKQTVNGGDRANAEKRVAGNMEDQAGALTTAEMKRQSSYHGFDFDAVWDIDLAVNNGYPFLRDVPVYSGSLVDFRFDQNAHHIMVASSEAKRISGATITINGDDYDTDADGYLRYTGGYGERFVTVNAAGYRTSVQFYNLKRGELRTIYLEADLGDGLTNLGTTVVRTFNLRFGKGGEAILDKNLPCELAPGDSAVFTEYVDISGWPSEATLTAETYVAGDADPSNNSSDFTLGLTDVSLTLSVYGLPEMYVLEASVANGSPLATDVDIKIRKGGEDGEIVDSQTVAALARGSSHVYQFAVDKEELPAEGQAYYVTAAPQQGDRNEFDNAASLILYPDPPDGGGGEPEEVALVPVTGLTVTGSKDIRLTLGAEPVTATAVAEIAPAAASNKGIEWTSADLWVATVDNEGLITAMGIGQTTVTATSSDGGFSDTITVTVDTDEELGLVVTAGAGGRVQHTDSSPYYSGDTVELLAIADGWHTFAGWYEGEEQVCAEEEYRFTLTDSRILVARFTPLPVPLTSISLSAAELILPPGGTRALAVAAYEPANTTADLTPTWTSSNPDVAAVDTRGTVRGVSVGTAEVVCTVAGVSASCRVSVSNKVEIYLNKSYLVLQAGTASQLAAYSDRALTASADVRWKSSDEQGTIAAVDQNGRVTAIGIGTAIITAYNEEYKVATECRVDVVTDERPISETVKAVNLLQNTVTSNVLSANYVKVPVQLVLEQNDPRLAGAPPANGAAVLAAQNIDSVELADDRYNYFTPHVVDDRFIELVPNIDNIPAKAAPLKTSLKVVVDGKTFTTSVLTVKISRAEPKLKAAALKFNSFFPNTPLTVAVSSTIGKVTGIRLANEGHASQVKFNEANGTIELNSSADNKTKKLVFLVEVDEFAGTYRVPLNASVTRKAPTVKLSAKSVAMRRTAQLQISGDGINRIEVENNGLYQTEGLDAQGRFTLSYTGEGEVPAKAGLKLRVGFAGTTQTVTVPLTVNKPPAYGREKVSLSTKTVTLNKWLDDRATVKINMNPVDAAPLDVTDISGDTDYLDTEIGGGVLEVSLKPAAVAKKSYRLNVGKAKLTVKVVAANPKITLKASGALNIIDPTSTITLTPKFTNGNYNGSEAMLDAASNEIFEIVGQSQTTGAVTLRIKDDVTVRPGTKQPVTLTYPGLGASLAVRITLRQLKPSLAASVKQVELLRNDRYSEGRVDIAVRKPAAGQIERVEIKGEASNLYKIREIQNGSYALGFRNDWAVVNAKQSANVKLDVYMAGSSAPVTVTVKVVVR